MIAWLARAAWSKKRAEDLLNDPDVPKSSLAKDGSGPNPVTARRGGKETSASTAERKSGAVLGPAFNFSNGLVLGFVDHLAGRDPRHHVTQLAADDFDLMLIVGPT